jgi:hypothetical protein
MLPLNMGKSGCGGCISIVSGFLEHSRFFILLWRRADWTLLGAAQQQLKCFRHTVSLNRDELRFHDNLPKHRHSSHPIQTSSFTLRPAYPIPIQLFGKCHLRSATVSPLSHLSLIDPFHFLDFDLKLTYLSILLQLQFPD